MRFLKIFLMLGLISLGISCSSNSPTQMNFDDNELASSMNYDDMNSLGIFGMYQIKIDESHTSYTVEPFQVRDLSLGEQFLGDVTHFMTTMFCRDCVRVDGIGLTQDNLVDVSIAIRHPFALPQGGPATGKNRLDLHLFDVEGLVLVDEGYNFPQAGITVRPGLLANADGYSGIFDTVLDYVYPTDNTIHPYKIFFEDTSEGNFDSQSLTTGFTDPYDPSGHNVFPQGSYYQASSFQFNLLPGKPLSFVLAVTASYGVSAKFGIEEGKPGNRLVPRYFLPRFNRYEAWKINANVPSYLNFLTSGDPKQSAEVRIDVWDWQDGKSISTYWDFYTSRAGEINISSYIKTVIIYVPSLMELPTYLNGSQGTGTNPKQFITKIYDELGAPPGRYWGLVCVNDSLDGTMSLVGFRRDGVTPFLYDNIRTYQFFPVEVKSASTAVPENPMDVTPLGLNGNAQDVIVSGNYAFVTMGVLGLTILDVSNPSSPVFVSSIDTYGNATRMAYNAAEKLLYIADGVAGISIINVTNPLSPTLKGAFDTAGMNDVRDVVFFGGFVYVGDGESGLAIVDVRDPELPTLSNYYPTRPKIRALTLKNTYLYKLDETDGLEILSLSNPEGPVSVNGLIIVGSKRDISIKDNTCAILMDDRLVTADVTNPYNPVLKGTMPLTSPTEGVVTVPGYAFIANGPNGVKAVSLSDLSNPAIIGVYDTPGWAKACYATTDTLYVSDSDSGLLALKVAGGGLSLKSSYKTTGMGWGLTVNEQNVYIASGYSGVKSVNIGIPEQARMEGTVNTPGYALDCEANGTALYATDSKSGLAVISIESPSQPVYLNNIQFPSWENWYADGVKVNGTYAALWGPQERSDFPDLIILDITNNYIPFQIGYLSTSRDFYNITFVTAFIYAAVGMGGVATVNMVNPDNPKFIALYSNGKYCSSVEGAGGNLFAMFQNTGMEILLSDNPENLVKISETYVSGTSMDVFVSGNYAYVSDVEGLVIIDITNVLNPYILSTHPVPGIISEIIVRGNYAYIAAREGGLRIIKLW